MTASVFVGTSLDGFLARPDGGLDFLPGGDGEPHGYDEFIASVDTIVIGRKTFETVLAFEAWPHGKRRVVVLSSRALDRKRDSALRFSSRTTSVSATCRRRRTVAALCRANTQ